MNFIITLLILILVLGIIVFIHELGHFLAAKKIGVYVHEFAINLSRLRCDWSHTHENSQAHC